ncbi:MAG: RdgB/HAM1 family non-canonical purine NTP pyrophosphatase [Cellvibrionales bacterium]|nr:RdgB/HAM1 family non-canonical purine NTP pyrophosphatase [Cellvibrionales bacterium]
MPTSALETTWVLATKNQGKLKEFKKLFAPLGITIISSADFNAGDIPETGTTFIENAIIKARALAKVSGLPTIADDSGLCVNALKGAPGLYSARFSEEGTDSANNAKLLTELDAIGAKDRSAYFYCALVLLRHADDPAPVIGLGQWGGEIAATAKGDNGFGYDPLFYVPDQDKHSAELLPEVKNQLSHRAKALQQLIAQL